MSADTPDYRANPAIIIQDTDVKSEEYPPLLGFSPTNHDHLQPLRFRNPHAPAHDSPPFRFGLPATPSASNENSVPTSSQVASMSTASLNWPDGSTAYTMPPTDYDEDEDAKDRAIRRRSSKACDQCRKSKCKCEGAGPSSPCRNCASLKQDCTFLGPSRKRGPPKGYIDAIEARLHQTEALVGILLAAGGVRLSATIAEGTNADDDGEHGRGRQAASKKEAPSDRYVDERAKELMADLAEDPVARAILLRIDQSAYGPAGRANSLPTSSGRSGAGSSGRASPAAPVRGNGAGTDASSIGDIGSMHPSHEWMDRVIQAVLRRSQTRQQHPPFDRSHSPTASNGGPPRTDGLSAYRYAYPQQPQLSGPPPSRSPQRPAIVTALGEYPRGYPQSAGPLEDRRAHSFDSHGRVSMPLSAGADGAPYYPRQGHGRAMPLSATPDARPMPFGAGGDSRRLRRRVDDGSSAAPPYFARHSDSPGASGTGGSDVELDLDVDVDFDAERERSRSRLGGDASGTPASPSMVNSLAAGLAGAVGQLSLNEDKEVRFHGKASGLHLLARQLHLRASEERDSSEVAVKQEDPEDGQNAGGIWRFPKARVWPAAPAPEEWDPDGAIDGDEDGLPPREVQATLLERYFLHVHPTFPVVHKQSLMDAFSRGEGPPPLLLLAMYALAARHAPQPTRDELESRQCMWPAGDVFLFRAKALLDSSYASSRASTCAALLLMGFREIGIGAMAQAWIYIGMAVRMAQDLGLHREAEGWVRAGVKVGKGAGAGGASGSDAASTGTPVSSRDAGDSQYGEERERSRSLGIESGSTGGDDARMPKDGRLFAVWELAERRRIWYACVIMDKYVSTYIGRPPAIYERDYDTSLPSETDAEETADWWPTPDSPVQLAPRPGHVISCFNASARLATIVNQILQSIYALRPQGSRHAELVVLDGLLEKWRLSLPEHLQYDPAVRPTSAADVPQPPVLTLHMQYWCTVLLLYRPFIQSPGKTRVLDDHGHAEKSYELCASAANHIASIATLYSETYTLKHCAVFLCYYTFTASITHVTSLFSYPNDPQARMGLNKCMSALRDMEIIWPAAARALVLLRSAQTSLADAAKAGGTEPTPSPVRRKRSATHMLDDSFVGGNPNASDSFVATRPYEMFESNTHYALQTRDSFYPSPVSDYPRWQGHQSADMGALAFQSAGEALSTAVMGPTFSTGLVDERQQQHPHHRPDTARYPQRQLPPPHQQYWNEYGPPPVAQGYPVALDVNIQHQHQPDPQMYSPLGQYNMYGHHGT
uniref:Zn(2)-C6 fungal-type domain-containing protein n=1 Tax=Mycena chlorophos TaxID=658473 RepID=A0ABQ0M414_MYCCL|nr:predicted protein [Mycena chlorophos]